MKVVLLAPATSVHTVRWANGLAERGVSVYLLSCHMASNNFHENVTLHILKNKAPLGYLTAVMEVRKLLASIKPDIVNAHYATGYGFLARITGYKPLMLSVWGSDVYDFPEKSFFHRCILKGNLKSATSIGSTSHCMVKKVQETYTHPHIYVTPFGVDEVQFSARVNRQNNKIVIGTVKTLKHKYGIDILLRAFAMVFFKLGRPDNVELMICGGGEELSQLQVLASQLEITGNVTFVGQIEYQYVPQYLNSFDIYIALSRFDSESFGVAVVEANACEKPVIVSDADGPAEVTIDGVTGFVVPKGNVEQAAEKLTLLIKDKELRLKMGAAGRAHVLENYTWDKSLNIMIEAYKHTINLKG